jgi:hypothetical protein
MVARRFHPPGGAVSLIIPSATFVAMSFLLHILKVQVIKFEIMNIEDLCMLTRPSTESSNMECFHNNIPKSLCALAFENSTLINYLRAYSQQFPPPVINTEASFIPSHPIRLLISFQLTYPIPSEIKLCHT